MWNWSENQIKILLIRHGATTANQEHRYLGKTDESLSMEGICALQEAKKANFYPRVDYLFSSPMKRCVETIKILYPDKQIFLIPEWEEMDFGDFEGKNYSELQGDERYQRWIDSNGTLPFPNGECRKDFIERCKQGFYRMLKQISVLSESKAGHDITVGLIVHGGTIMALLSSFYGGEYFAYQSANGQGYLCVLKEEGGYPKMAEIQKIREGKL